VPRELGIGGVGAGVTPTAFWMASTMVDTMNPNAVRINVMVFFASKFPSNSSQSITVIV